MQTRASIDELRALINELRVSISEQKAFITDSSELRSTDDLRASICDLPDIIIGHERHIICLDGKQIDWWEVDRIMLADRVRKLEEWEAKYGIEND